MTRIICVGSGKGGVGKTTTVANLAAALAGMNKSVVAIDSNTTTSNLGLHLGIPLYPKTLQDVLKRKARLREAVYHHPAGFRILPADVSLAKLMLPKSNSLMDVFYNLKADYVLIDSAAGLGQEALSAVEASDELLTVVTPDVSSLTDALKLVRIAKKLETRNIGVVVNMVRGEGHEFTEKEITNFLGLKVIGKIPEDRHVREATHNKTPVVIYRPGTKASKQFNAVAAKIAGRVYIPQESILQRLFGRLR